MQNNAAMQNRVKLLMDEYLPATYLYHNYKHCEDVRASAVEIGTHEKINKDEIRLLETAALWHDVGYIKMRTGHEEESCRMAKENLPDYGFNDAEIKTICGMIMATKAPQSPMNNLEKIIADADLAYLGSEEAFAKAENLFEELHSADPSLTKEKWNKTQIKFLQSHKYFTQYGKEIYEPLKQAYLERLLNQY